MGSLKVLKFGFSAAPSIHYRVPNSERSDVQFEVGKAVFVKRDRSRYDRSLERYLSTGLRPMAYRTEESLSEFGLWGDM